MATDRDQQKTSQDAALDDDSAVSVLRQLEEERGKMFNEAEYEEMRRAVLDEIAHGARLRPFTIFTFSIIMLGLVALVGVGIVTGSGHAVGDYLLALVSGVALLATGYFLWSCARGIRLDAERSLDTRLDELGKLREQHLVSTEEYDQILAHILIARQRAAVHRQ